jgi:MTH538 TIR-like domain (DUF1863).
MPTLKPYHLFISHAWSYGDQYNSIINLLDNASNFTYYNYSAPSDNPLKNTDGSDATNAIQIESSIYRKIERSNCVIVIAGMYAIHRKWMGIEIAIAVKLKKPIIALYPRGNKVMPLDIVNVSKACVSWNTDSIVSAIRQYSI